MKTPAPSRITLKQQMHLEVIGDLEREHGHSHVSAIAERVGVSKPSVVQMLARLEVAGLIRRDHKEIFLTQRGRQIVSELAGSQAALEDFMVGDLGMDAETAAAEACRMEHVVSPAFIAGLRRLRSRRAPKS